MNSGVPGHEEYVVECEAEFGSNDGHVQSGAAVRRTAPFIYATAHRRPMRVVSEDDGEEELAMTLPLAGDRGGIASW